ncbi:NERD domain-containing protein [Streptomyces sp. QL37]|uniref:nuclease-related domain-containing protein n=1 Tax=Streptomyces sp. QL37 TaxID=2093747 RepID=UPI000CF242F6|nr:nuclease-related domain-containing protein [Streptomyces sp. QL37]PPQ59716.1 NERD nuclease [Streptomyces sp. QL37]
MQDLKVTSWQLFGHDRLYVNLPDGTAIGWADRGSGTITVLHPRYRDAVTDALARQVPDLPALVGEEVAAGPHTPPVPPPVPRIPPMRGMRKRGAAQEAPPVRGPAPTAEPRRAAVPEAAPAPGVAPVPEAVPAADVAPVSEAVPAADVAHVPEAVPAPETAPVPEAVAGPTPVPERRRRPAVLPALTPATDLASRRPGTGLREQLGESGTGALVRAATGALRRHKDPDPRRGALAGERRVGAELKRLTRHGWRVLHSVPLPDGTEIGHLLIGPGGVFAVSTDHRPGASVRIGDGTLRIDDGAPQPYELDGGPGARRARAALEAYCAFDVPVQTVLVFTGVTALEVASAPAGIRVFRERQVSVLAPLTGAFTPTQVERVYDVARNGEAWLDA